mmetsp:Transcript_58315/g.162540  ORF Transcript_58315/g.162540 Transcript_58315/m.162540 type:complete len:320 (-) Transcript_58315:97-1056(-)|eukprot:CAMPEP_0117523416 /NCGR_PEP_ID=MMETSP0784-20121206/34717_1 /TAXON_ID=39447 /ORGANISM="" /LENGTH=319 /DNA_ID=CAMNT_0005319529 /DNA_START=51 /DNA_END=1010 /DNA_ORIENTATION=+
MGGDFSETVLATSSWVVCSIGMMVFNKLAVRDFPLECSLVVLQMLVTVVIILVVRWNHLHIGSTRDLARWLRVVPFFSGVLLSSMFALSRAPMSLVIVFRGLAPIFSLLAERFYPEPLKVNQPMLCTLFALLGGVFMYIYDVPLKNNLGGIVFVLLNNFFVVGDRLLQRLMLGRDQAPVDISKESVTIINNSFGTIPLLIVAVFLGEPAKIPMAVQSLDVFGWLWIVLSCLVGVGIAYTGIWTQSLITATSFLVLACSNKFFVLLIEVFIIGSKVLAPKQFLGAIVTIVAGVWYGKVRQEAERKSTQLGETTRLNRQIV